MMLDLHEAALTRHVRKQVQAPSIRDRSSQGRHRAGHALGWDSTFSECDDAHLINKETPNDQCSNVQWKCQHVNLGALSVKCYFVALVCYISSAANPQGWNQARSLSSIRDRYDMLNKPKRSPIHIMIYVSDSPTNHSQSRCMEVSHKSVSQYATTMRPEELMSSPIMVETGTHV
eukprot:1229579-Amphidinium_carterae.1